MEHIWEAPEHGFVKINVHCTLSELPVQNGNINGVGVIIRNEHGEKLWAALGPMDSLTEEQAIMSGIQAGCIEAQRRGWEQTHIEISNRNVFDVILMQEHIVLQDNLVEAFGLFNTVQTNHYKDGEIDRRISRIPASMNGTTQYLAEYGMQHLSVFAEIPSLVGELSYHLDHDMGMTIMSPIREAAQNLGDGEVLDAAPPLLGVKRSHSCVELGGVWSLNNKYHCAQGVEQPLLLPSSSQGPMVGAKTDKGKDKLFKEFSFNVDGVMCQKACKLMDERKLAVFSDFFKQKVVDLDAPLMSGIYARDVLHHAVNGTMKAFLDLKSSEWESVFLQLKDVMHVEEVMWQMGFADAPKKRAKGPSA